MNQITAGTEGQFSLTDFRLRDTDILCTVTAPEGEYTGKIVNRNPLNDDDDGYFVRIPKLKGIAKLSGRPPISYLPQEVPTLPYFFRKIDEKEFYSYENLYEPYSGRAWENSVDGSVYLEILVQSFINRWANGVRIKLIDQQSGIESFEGLRVRQIFCTTGFVFAEIHLNEPHYIRDGLLYDFDNLFSSGTVAVNIGGDFDLTESQVLYLKVSIAEIAGKDNTDNLRELLR